MLQEHWWAWVWKWFSFVIQYTFVLFCFWIRKTFIRKLKLSFCFLGSRFAEWGHSPFLTLILCIQSERNSPIRLRCRLSSNKQCFRSCRKEPPGTRHNHIWMEGTVVVVEKLDPYHRNLRQAHRVSHQRSTDPTNSFRLSLTQGWQRVGCFWWKGWVCSWSPEMCYRV